jgi:hypothetical protein
MMRPLLTAALLLTIGLVAAPRSAVAGVPELRLAVARLIESLDAGLGPAELRQQRIDINAEIRVLKLTSFTLLADPDELARALAAAHQGWTVLLGLASCQPNEGSGAAREPAACQAALAPHLRELKVTPPDLSRPMTTATVLQPMLQALRKVAEKALRDLR